MQTKGSNSREMPSKDKEGMANGAECDQTAPLCI